MPSITSAGIGSGLDIAGIVQQLVAAEAAPVETRIGQLEARTVTKLSAFGSLKSALADFRDKLEIMNTMTSFLKRKASSEDEGLFTVSPTETAVPADYSIEIEQLAEAQKLTSGAFIDADTEVGTGILTLTVGVLTFDVDITAENNTLSGIRDAINAAADNAGIAATIVNADAGSYLILTADKTGASNSMTVTQAGGDGGLSALEYDPGNGLNSLSESQAAMDSIIRIDGLVVVSDTNSVAGAIDGVTLSLVSANPGNPATLTIENDDDAVRQTITDFVETYNVLIDTFDQLTDYDAESELAAPLIGDATIRSIREQIRREFSTAVGNPDLPFTTLSEIGLETQLDGRLNLVEEDLSDVIASDFTRIGQLFTASDGFAVRLFNLVDTFLASDGIIETKTEGLENRIDEFSDQRDALGERLASLETRLLRQFNALDSLISQLSSTSNFLTQQLANLPGFTRDDNN